MKDFFKNCQISDQEKIAQIECISIIALKNQLKK